MDAAGATRARVEPSSALPDAATRAGARSRPITPEERARLRSSFGALLWRERVTVGLTQRQLAERVGMHATNVAKLESGAQRPSDGGTFRLARALRPNAELVDVALLDLRLQQAAGSSLYRWRRRHRRPVAVQRAYAEARARLARGSVEVDDATALTVARALLALEGEPAGEVYVHRPQVRRTT
jgi:transcriptional regulator with XRE-family HTH domain